MISDNFVDVIKEMRERFGHEIGCGASRMGFEHKKWVLKVPTNSWGIRDNLREASIYRRTIKNEVRPFFVPAACRIVNMYVAGRRIPVLIMERLKLFNVGSRHADGNDLPLWVKDLFDGWQIGLDKHGVVKSYDYALEQEGL